MKRGLPPEFFLACRRWGIRPTPLVLQVSVSRQRLIVFGRTSPQGRDGGYHQLACFLSSTSRMGTGQVAESNRTPLGLHRIAEKHGGGWPVGTVFRDRVPVGFTWAGKPEAAIAHRILWLEGLEPGFNRGGEVDTFRRYIYIHGVGNETRLGRPASLGCIHLAGADLLPLYDRLPAGTLVWINQR